MTLTDFLLARIAEQERAAHILAERNRRPLLAESPAVDHPAFILADLAAKRRIVADYLTFRKVADDRAEGTPLPQALTTAGIVTGYERAVATLALPFADHPDYREQWKP